MSLVVLPNARYIHGNAYIYTFAAAARARASAGSTSSLNSSQSVSRLWPVARPLTSFLSAPSFCPASLLNLLSPSYILFNPANTHIHLYIHIYSLARAALRALLYYISRVVRKVCIPIRKSNCCSSVYVSVVEGEKTKKKSRSCIIPYTLQHHTQDGTYIYIHERESGSVWTYHAEESRRSVERDARPSCLRKQLRCTSVCGAADVLLLLLLEAVYSGI